MTQLVIHPVEQTPESPSRSFTPIIAGVALTILALHVVVTRPLMGKIDSLNRQVVTMQQELDAVAGSQENAWRTNDLLTALTIQAERLDSADLALSRFDGLATRMDDLNERVVTLATVTENAFAVVDEFDQLHDRLAAAAGTSGAIRRDLRDIEIVTDRIDELANQTPKHRDALDVLHMQSSEMTAIATQLDMETRTISNAKNTLGTLTAIASKLDATETERAATTAEGLINIAGRIESDGSALLGPAGNVIANLKVATSGLEEQDERLESLVETADVLQDFEAEMLRHIQGLETMRRELVEFAMMDSTIDRVAQSLAPLTELANLRRLQSDDLEVVVDALRDQQFEVDEPMIAETTETTEATEITETTDEPNLNREPIRTADRLVPEPVQMLR